jgi:hypothetical protein
MSVKPAIATLVLASAAACLKGKNVQASPLGCSLRELSPIAALPSKDPSSPRRANRYFFEPSAFRSVEESAKSVGSHDFSCSQ